MASLLVLITALASFTSGAVLNASAVNRLTRGSGSYTATEAPCQKYFAPFDDVGCYDDSRDRVLPWQILGLDGSLMTPAYCQAACKSNNFKFAGVEYSSQCWCNVALSGIKLPTSECSLPCNGDQTQDCGGDSRVKVYQDHTFDMVTPGATTGFRSAGCYSEATQPPALAILQDYLDPNTMTVETCIEACKSRGFPLAGLNMGNQCSCGVILADGASSVSPDQCDTNCAGQSNQTCGDRDFYSLYVSAELRESHPCDYSKFPDY